ncbi:MAG: hypothetical protein F4Z04_07950 [Acidobacteria bacterium]|nr:hypothetical protein [Acidobacteriota bacterium]
MDRLVRNNSRLLVMLLALALGSVAAVASRGAWNSDDLPQVADPELHGRQAYHLAQHGEFRFPGPIEPDGPHGAPPGPYSPQPPGYSAYLAAILVSAPEFSSLTWPCIRDASCAAGSGVRWRARFVTAVVRGVTVGATVLAVFLFTGRLTPAALGGLLCLLLLQRDTPTLLAGLLLLAHAALVASTWNRPRLLTGLASGVALGLLVLVNAIYQYSLIGVPLVWLAGVFLHRERWRSTAPAFAALAVAAWAVTLPWMVRNATHDGAFAISGGGGKVLAHRAEYGLMTWSELRGAFAWFLPPQLSALREPAMRWLTPDTYGYARFDRDADEGFYRRVRNSTGDVAARADQLDPDWRTAGLARQDDTLRAVAAQVYVENWPKQLALTAVFAQRGTWGLWLPGAGLVAFLVWRRRDYTLAFLLLPVAWTAVGLAVGTHFLERYAYPFIPVSAVVVALALHEAWLWAKANGRFQFTGGKAGEVP